MKAVLIKGNPRFTRVEEAKAYYNDIIEFMEGLGVAVIVDEGKSETCPPHADFYVAHSRGCDREVCFQGRGRPGLHNLIKLGVPDGIINTIDLEWWNNGRPGVPPREHFVFTADQKLAIQSKVDELNAKNVSTVVPQQSRQSASRRPGVR